MNPVEALCIDTGEVQRTFPVVPALATARERMKPVPHEQELDRGPSCPDRLEAVRVVQLAPKLPDDSLGHVGVPRHAGTVEVRPQVRKPGLEEGHGVLQPLREKLRSGVLPLGVQVSQMAPIRGIAELVTQVQERPMDDDRDMPREAQPAPQRPQDMYHADLNRGVGKHRACRRPKSRILVQNKAFQRVAESLDVQERGLPGAEVLVGEQAGLRDILRPDVGRKAEGVLDAPDAHGPAIGQQIPVPTRPQLAGYLGEALALQSQLLHPSPDRVGLHAQIAAHCPVRSLDIEVPEDGLGLDLLAELGRVEKGAPTRSTLPALNADCPSVPFHLPCEPVSPDRPISTVWARFFPSAHFLFALYPNSQGDHISSTQNGTST